MRFENERNITLFLIWKATRSGLFWIPLFILYYQSFGLSYTEIMLLPVITGIAQLLLEVPSGVMADLVGRKYALFLGSALWAASFYALLIAKGMPMIIVSVILFGAALAFLSGSDSAFLYDTLRAANREKEYKQIAGKGFALQSFGMAFGSLIGAPIAALYGFQFTLTLVFGAMTLSAFLPIFMKEPPHFKESQDRRFFHHLKEAIAFTVHHPRVRRFILYLGSFLGLMVISHRLFQPAMVEASIPLFWFGPLYCVWLLVAAAGAIYAEKIEERIGEKRTLILLPLLLIASYLPLSTYLGAGIILFLVLNEFVWGFIRPVIEEYVNKHVESHHRATVLSLSGFLMSVTIFLFAPIIGVITDAFGLKGGFLSLSIIIIAMALLLVPPMVQRKHSWFSPPWRGIRSKSTAARTSR